MDIKPHFILFHFIYSTRFIHKLVSLPSPTDNELVTNVLEAAKRKLAKPCCKKLPITVELLHLIFDKLSLNINLYNQRSVVMFLLAFLAF